MINIFQKWLQIPEDKLLVIREIVNSLHTSSLMYSHYRNAFMYRIDDIEDNSKQRRGVPGGILLYQWGVAAHEVFGVASTINAANYVYFIALEQVCTSFSMKCSANPWTAMRLWMYL